MSISEDYQTPVGSRAEMKKATSIKLIHHINSKVKDPPKMIMFRSAQYEATVNGVGYGQSQLLVMSDLPTEATIFGKHPIELLAAPSGITHLNTRNGTIVAEHLLQVGWKHVIVNCAPERNVTLQGVIVGNQECPSVTSCPVVYFSVVPTSLPEGISGEPRSIRLQ
jgi:hypothetical protein